MEAIDIFFSENPGAEKCYVALGYVKATKEEAEALLGGSKGELAIFEREAGRVYELNSEKALTAVIEAEELEEAAHREFETVKTEDAMQAWKLSQKNAATAKAAYEKQLKKEEKELKMKVEDEAAKTGKVDLVEENKTAVIPVD